MHGRTSGRDLSRKQSNEMSSPDDLVSITHATKKIEEGDRMKTDFQKTKSLVAKITGFLSSGYEEFVFESTHIFLS
jgi:hypothetical protein